MTAIVGMRGGVDSRPVLKLGSLLLCILSSKFKLRNAFGQALGNHLCLRNAFGQALGNHLCILQFNASIPFPLDFL